MFTIIKFSLVIQFAIVFSSASLILSIDAGAVQVSREPQERIPYERFQGASHTKRELEYAFQVGCTRLCAISRHVVYLACQTKTLFRFTLTGEKFIEPISIDRTNGAIQQVAFDRLTNTLLVVEHSEYEGFSFDIGYFVVALTTNEKLIDRKLAVRKSDNPHFYVFELAVCEGQGLLGARNMFTYEIQLFPFSIAVTSGHISVVKPVSTPLREIYSIACTHTNDATFVALSQASSLTVFKLVKPLQNTGDVLELQRVSEVETLRPNILNPGNLRPCHTGNKIGRHVRRLVAGD